MAASVAVLLVAGVLVATTGGDDDTDAAGTTAARAATSTSAAATSSATTSLAGTGPGEILLEPVGRQTVPAFTPVAASGERPPTASMPTLPTTTPTTAAPATTVAPPTTQPGAVAVQTVAGSLPGLYGGSRDKAVCDPEQLVAFLEQNPDKGAAWAAVQGIRPSEIRAYVATLTPVILGRDTRVTNHGYRNGIATPIQSVLQAGTAVLVDAYGVPRVKCYCGNPLVAPVPASRPPTYVGDPWPRFTPATVVVVVVDIKVDVLVLVDVDTGVPFSRPIGTTIRDGDVLVDTLCDLYPEDPRCRLVDLNGPWAGTLVFDTIDTGGQPAPEGCDLNEVIDQPFGMSLDMVANPDGTGTATVLLSPPQGLDTGGATPTPISVPLTWQGNEVRFNVGDATGSLAFVGQASRGADGREIVKGTLSSATEGVTAVGTWEVSR